MHCFFMRAGHIADLSTSMTGLSDQDAITKAHLLFSEPGPASTVSRFGIAPAWSSGIRTLRPRSLRPISRGIVRRRRTARLSTLARAYRERRAEAHRKSRQRDVDVSWDPAAPSRE